MKKKIISLFLSVVMVLTMVPTYSFMAYADDTASSDTVISSGIDNIDGDDEDEGPAEPDEPTEPECTHIFTADKIPAENNSFWETHSKSDYYVGSKAFIDAKLPASCTTDGWSIAKTETTGFCMICGQVITENDKVILPATGHSYADAEEYAEGDNCENLVQPTCTDKGSAECKNINAKLTAVFNEGTGLYEAAVDMIPCEETVDIDALGHDLAAGEVVEPTCEDDGYTVYECTRCDYTENSDVVDALGHDWKTVAREVEATCTATGRTEEKLCQRCGKTEGGEEVPAAGHKYNVTVAEDGSVSADDFYAALEIGAEGVRLDQEPTCTVEGTGIVKCTVCGNEVTVTVGKLAHDDEEKVLIPVDCIADGVTEKTCKNCGRTERVVVPSLGHSYVANVIEPNCATGEAGYTEYTCTRCGYSYKANYVAAQHDEEVKDVEILKDATCEDDGLKIVQKVCKVCGTVITTTYAAIPHFGHDYVGTVTAPTCTEAGYTDYVCQNDPAHKYRGDYVDPIDHDYQLDTQVAPTCTEDGYDLYVCQNDNSHTKTVEYPALGHIEGDAVLDEDSVEGCVIAYDEEGNIVATATSCTENGQYDMVVYCVRVLGQDEDGNDIVCREELSRETVVVKAAGHQYEINKKLTVYPTCEREGYNYYTCAKCGANTVSEPIPALGHLTPADYDVLANCQHGDQYTCQRETYEEDADNHRILDENGDFVVNGVCGAFIDEGEKNTALKFNDEYKNAVVLPDGENQVHLPSIAIPENAEVYLARGEFDPDNLVDYSVVDGKLVTGHAEATLNGAAYDVEGFYTYEFFEATCEFDAYYVFTCKCCNGSEENGVFVVELINTAIGHRWALRDDLTNRDPSCTQDGTRYWFCLNDNGHQYTEKIPATGHNYQLVTTVAATCTESAYNLYVCYNTAEDNDPDSANGEVCGDDYKEFTAPALGHDFAEDVTQYVAPGCNTEGKRVYVCKRTDCTETYTVIIPKTDNHTYTLDGTTPATCTKEGTATYKCQDDGCDAQYTINTTPRTGHQYVENKNMFVAPTCIAQGYRYFECVNDNDGVKCDSHYTVMLAKVAHTPVSANNAVAATCTRAGKKADTICSVCGVVITSGDVIPATGHNYGKVNVENPTCTDKGYTIHYCTNAGCTDMYIDTYTAKIPHTLEVVNTVAATCGEDGFVKKRCTNCDYTVMEVLPATGNHKYYRKVTVQPTCTAKGVMTYTCSVCGYTYEEEIPVLAHSAVSAGNAVAPTCTKAGKESDTICSACGITLAIGSVVSPTGHNYGKVDIVPATCQTEGYTVYTCTNDKCGYSYITDITDIADHVIAKIKTTPATCISDGSVVYECANCNYGFYEVIPATGHTWVVTDVQPATCTKEGFTAYECSVCGDTRIDDRTPIDNTAHNYVVTDSKEATCLAEGYDVYTCNNIKGYDVEVDENGEVVKETPIYCGDTYKVTTTPKTGHSYKTIKYTPATCIANGFWTNECTVCKNITIVEDDLTATGHDWVETYVKATTTKDGSKTTACALCGISTTDRIAQIATVQLSATKFTYTGKQIKPVVTVTDVDGNVIGSTHYTVTYKNNKKIGKATVTVTFKGNKYEGVVRKTFTIIPKKAGISDIHSGKKSIKFTWGRVGNCDGYQIQYSTSKTFKSAKSVTIKSNKTVTKNITGLKSGKKYYIRIRAYKIVDGKKIYGEWNTTKKARLAK